MRLPLFHVGEKLHFYTFILLWSQRSRKWKFASGVGGAIHFYIWPVENLAPILLLHMHFCEKSIRILITFEKMASSKKSPRGAKILSPRRLAPKNHHFNIRILITPQKCVSRKATLYNNRCSIVHCTLNRIFTKCSLFLRKNHHRDFSAPNRPPQQKYQKVSKMNKVSHYFWKLCQNNIRILITFKNPFKTSSFLHKDSHYFSKSCENNIRILITFKNGPDPWETSALVVSGAVLGLGAGSIF